jgi:hypothetical protein
MRAPNVPSTAHLMTQPRTTLFNLIVIDATGRAKAEPNRQLHGFLPGIFSAYFINPGELTGQKFHAALILSDLDKISSSRWQKLAAPPKEQQDAKIEQPKPKRRAEAPSLN